MGSSANRSVIIASLSTLLALGLFRFAYSALLPLLIAAQWFSASTALYLSAANLCGYLMGALSANPLNRRFSHTQLIITAALLGSASLLACAIAHLPIAWYVVWRMVAGITGAWLMVLAPSWALRQVPVAAKNTASAWVFAGIGMGVCRHRLWGLVIGIFIALHAKLGLKIHLADFRLWQLAVEPAHHLVVAQTPAHKHHAIHSSRYKTKSHQASICQCGIHHLGLWLFWHGLFAPRFVLGGLFGA